MKRLRRRLDEVDLVQADAAAEGARTRIELDYPVTPRARWGWGRPPHARLAEILDQRRSEYVRHLEGILGLGDALVRIPVHEPDEPGGPCWVNGWLPGLDAAALYTFVVRNEPRTYLEVGSGWSTRFVRRAVTDHGLATRIVSIDPQPRAEVDALCDEVIRRPAEEVDGSLFAGLGRGDVLFVDDSHRCLQNSDATAMFLDVLPELAPGVLVELHDICLPDDYPPDWSERFYSEQYVLAAFLLAPGSTLKTVLPCHYVSHDIELAAVLDPLWNDPRVAGVERHGGSFWIESNWRSHG